MKDSSHHHRDVQRAVFKEARRSRMEELVMASRAPLKFRSSHEDPVWHSGMRRERGAHGVHPHTEGDKPWTRPTRQLGQKRMTKNKNIKHRRAA